MMMMMKTQHTPKQLLRTQTLTHHSPTHARKHTLAHTHTYSLLPTQYFSLNHEHRL